MPQRDSGAVLSWHITGNYTSAAKNAVAMSRRVRRIRQFFDAGTKDQSRLCGTAESTERPLAALVRYNKFLKQAQLSKADCGTATYRPERRVGKI